MTLRRLLLLATVAGAVLASATTASAGHKHARVPLPLVPLETAQLGSAGASLALNPGSGYQDQSGGVVFLGGPPGFSSGPTNVYALDYGDPFTGSTGVMEIRSDVEEYPSRRVADLGLKFKRLISSAGLYFGSPLVSVKQRGIKAEHVGQRRFASLTTFSATNLNPIVKLDEEVVMGRYILDLTVTAGSASAAEHVAPHLMRLLHSRLRRLIWGHSVKGTRQKVPEVPPPGQAPGGPDLSTLILQPNDVGQPHAVDLIQLYTLGLPALSDYIMLLQPAGTYQTLEQQIAWWPTATEATYGETYQSALSPGFAPLFGGGGGSGTPVDLSSVGDGATGYVVNESDGSLVYIRLANGQAGESVVALSNSPITNTDAQNLAQSAANRLDAGLP